MDDFERGYAKGYERALQQLVEHLEFDIASPLVMAYVRAAAEKLRREVLND